MLPVLDKATSARRFPFVENYFKSFKETKPVKETRRISPGWKPLTFQLGQCEVTNWEGGDWSHGKVVISQTKRPCVHEIMILCMPAFFPLVWSLTHWTDISMQGSPCLFPFQILATVQVLGFVYILDSDSSVSLSRSLDVALQGSIILS